MLTIEKERRQEKEECKLPSVCSCVRYMAWRVIYLLGEQVTMAFLIHRLRPSQGHGGIHMGKEMLMLVFSMRFY